MADDQLDALKLPPHSIEAEQSVIGGLLLENEALDKIADILKADDFYQHDHKTIFKHIGKLIEHNRPADIVTVAESLESTAELSQIGGIAYLGALAQNTPTAANIRRYAEIVRERAIMRKLVTVGSGIAESAYSPNGRDAQQLLDEAEAKIFQIAEGGQRTSQGFKDIKELLPQVAERIDMLFSRDNPSDVTGIPTGFSDLDSMTSGFQGGDLIIVAGRPSMGKTAFSLNVAENVALDTGLPVAVFSMEMASTQLAMRMIGSVGRLDQHRMRTGRLEDEDWEKLTTALGRLNEAPIFIDEGAGLSSFAGVLQAMRAPVPSVERVHAVVGVAGAIQVPVPLVLGVLLLPLLRHGGRVGGVGQHLFEEVDVTGMVHRVEVAVGGVGHDDDAALSHQWLVAIHVEQVAQAHAHDQHRVHDAVGVVWAHIRNAQGQDVGLPLDVDQLLAMDVFQCDLVHGLGLAGLHTGHLVRTFHVVEDLAGQAQGGAVQ